MFSLMDDAIYVGSLTKLIDKVNYLEQTVMAIQSELETCKAHLKEHIAQPDIHSASKFHYIEVIKDYSEGVSSKIATKEAMDIVFRNRNVFEPCFAAWYPLYDVDEVMNNHVTYFLIATIDTMSTLNFKKLIKHHSVMLEHRSLDFALFKQFEMERFNSYTQGSKLEYWYYDVNELTNSYSWNKEISTSQSPLMTNDQFSQSDNYIEGAEVQEFLDEYIRHNDVNNLVRAVYM
jgi:hypothetical protein